MIYFKLIEKVDDLAKGPVLSTAILGGDTMSHSLKYKAATSNNVLQEPIKGFINSTVITLDYFNISDDALTSLTSSLLIGPADTNVKYDTEVTDPVVYDAVTNKVFTDYILDETIIKANYELIKDKTLIVRAGSSKSFFKPSQTFTDFTLANNATTNKLEITLTNNNTFSASTSVDITNGPGSEIIPVIIKNNWHSRWSVQIPKTARLETNYHMDTTESDDRYGYVSNESIKMLTPTIIQTAVKGLTGDGTDLTRNLGNPFIYIYNTEGTPETPTVLDVDQEKGLILLKEPLLGYENLLIDYTVDHSYITNDTLQFNPLLDRIAAGGLTALEKPYFESVDLWLSETTPGIFYSVEGADAAKYKFNTGYFSNSLENAYTLGRVSLEYKEPSYLDIRKEGGMIINTTESDDAGPLHDIKSHTSIGFMGQAPEQTNAIVAGIGSNIIKNLITHFDSEAATPFSGTISSGSSADIISYVQNYENSEGINLIRIEIEDAVKRYVALGVPVVITLEDTGDIIYTPTDETKLTSIAGGY